MSFTALTTKYLGKTLFGYTIGTYVSYIKWILILSILSFVMYKGYDFYNHYTSLVKTVSEQKVVIDDMNERIGVLQKANEDLKKAEELQEKSGKISTDSVGDLAKKNEETTNKFSDIKETTKNKVAAVKARPFKRIKKPNTTEEVEVPMTEGEITEAVSKIRITSIWRSYCSSNKPAENSTQTCKEVLI